MKQIPLIQFGVGNVGRALIEQVIATRPRHAETLNLHLEYIALVDRNSAIVDSEGLDDTHLQEIVGLKAAGGRLSDLEMGYHQDDPVAIVDVAGTEGAIIIDTTATSATVPALLQALAQGYQVVTANKLPLTDTFALFQRLTAGRQIRYETTVGAGLPVVRTLQTLVDTGDRVHQIQGCLSGTLGFICAQLEAGRPFSQAVREAKQRGYTEPDPREDLAGSDAARKTLIMARMLGYPIEFEDVEIERLYPPEMDDWSVEEFLERVDALDEQYAELAEEARAAGRPLRYVGEVIDGRCRVSLTTVDPDSRLAAIQASDSIVVFQTARYGENPLVISGRGAGPHVTAAGVLGDILDLVI